MAEPRLLTERQAADYLGLPAATVRKLTFGHVRLGARHRYDRKAFDVHLDRLAGLDSSLELNMNKPDAELARFIAITRILPGVHRIKRAKANRVFEYWYAWRGGPQILAAQASSVRSLAREVARKAPQLWKPIERRSSLSKAQLTSPPCPL